MSLPDVLATFPNAKIIGAELSQEKLKFVNAIDKYHYLSTDSDDLAKANEQLKGEGIEIINIDGDVCAHAILCIVDNRIILGNYGACHFKACLFSTYFSVRFIL